MVNGLRRHQAKCAVMMLVVVPVEESLGPAAGLDNVRKASRISRPTSLPPFILALQDVGSKWLLLT